MFTVVDDTNVRITGPSRGKCPRFTGWFSHQMHRNHGIVLKQQMYYFSETHPIIDAFKLDLKIKTFHIVKAGTIVKLHGKWCIFILNPIPSW